MLHFACCQAPTPSLLITMMSHVGQGTAPRCRGANSAHPSRCSLDVPSPSKVQPRSGTLHTYACVKMQIMYTWHSRLVYIPEWEALMVHQQHCARHLACSQL